MKVSACGKTDIGRTREENEDAFLISDALGLYAVADGLGGLPGGREASTLSLQVLESSLQSVTHTDASELGFAIAAANAAVFQDGHQAFGPDGNGTTLTVAWIIGDRVHLGHVGDSAAFLFRQGELRQLTAEHTMAAQMASQMDASQHRRIPAHLHHTLTRCVGQTEDLEIDSLDYEARSGDRLILATDGLSKTVVNRNMRSILSEFPHPADAAQKLVEEAFEAGSTDNITVVVLAFQDQSDEG